MSAIVAGVIRSRSRSSASSFVISSLAFFMSTASFRIPKRSRIQVEIGMWGNSGGLAYYYRPNEGKLFCLPKLAFGAIQRHNFYRVYGLKRFWYASNNRQENSIRGANKRPRKSMDRH